MNAAEPPQLEITEVDIGPCRAMAFDQSADQWVILLPGANYATTAPLLWFAREAAMAGGRNVLAVTDRFERGTEPLRWAEDRAEAALRHVGNRPETILAAKSITSLAAPLAARRGLRAIWLTPLLGEGGTSVSQAVADGLAAASAPFLLIGGTADPAWDGTRARSFARGKALEIADADHALQVPGDPGRSLRTLHRVTSAISDFIVAGDGMGGDGRLVGLDHVQLAMPAGGEDRARTFYADLLGLREVTKPDRLASRGGCWFVGSGLHLHLGIAPDFQPATKAHPGLVAADLDGLRSRLRAAGVEVTDDDSVPSVRRFYAADPFGNRLEFIDERSAGFTESL